MNVRNLNEQVSVSGQISEADVKKLVEQGVSLIICNRPDGEDLDQTPFNNIEETTKSLGIKAYFLPVSSSDINQSVITQFKRLMNKEKRIHAYCRTGNRSTKIFNAATMLKQN